MKKFLIIFALLITFILPAKADVMPYYVGSINQDSIGVYQAENNVRIYKDPNVNSQLLLNINWDAQNYNSTDVSASNLFMVFLPKKNLAFLTVVDENDNEDWVEVSYNQNGLKTGWVKKTDDYRFLPWRAFVSLYGRKYGMYYMKDAPADCKNIYGSTADDAKNISTINVPQSIKLTGISGNWILIIAYDIDKYEKIGWIKWRNISGEIFLFPDIK